jgi:protein-S-isoprenylcysteine O-methyltransferase Ste14
MNVDLINVLVQIAVMLVIYALPVFIPGGIKAWPAAWVYLGMWFGFWFGMVTWLYFHNPGLFNERMRLSASDQHRRDKMFAPVFYGFLFLWLLLMSFDAVHFHGSPVPIWLQVIGGFILLFSFYIFFLTFRENSYLSPVVRIQEERGQKVISSGPYRYVRHPMYAATLVFIVGTPLLLGSWYGIPAGLILVLLLAWRALLEESTLRNELPGYGIYMANVKYRLVPYIW